MNFNILIFFFDNKMILVKIALDSHRILTDSKKKKEKRKKKIEKIGLSLSNNRIKGKRKKKIRGENPHLTNSLPPRKKRNEIQNRKEG